MEKKIDYEWLYNLQDKVLEIAAKLENDFYLTGGTALHRFYYFARYSDDLDFFVSNGQNFHEDVNEFIDAILNSGFSLAVDVKTRDFVRITVNDQLQIDFVNDRVYRYKKSVIIDGIRVDNKINILTNKINAIINRDEEKDMFDLFCLAYHESFNWKEILDIANRKAVIEKAILLYRIKKFPLGWLDKIKIIKQIEITQEKIEILYQDILNDNENSLKV